MRTCACVHAQVKPTNQLDHVSDLLHSRRPAAQQRLYAAPVQRFVLPERDHLGQGGASEGYGGYGDGW
jgi:hypothetical protein